MAATFQAAVAPEGQGVGADSARHGAGHLRMRRDARALAADHRRLDHGVRGARADGGEAVIRPSGMRRRRSEDR